MNRPQDARHRATVKTDRQGWWALATLWWLACAVAYGLRLVQWAGLG